MDTKFGADQLKPLTHSTIFYHKIPTEKKVPFQQSILSEKLVISTWSGKNILEFDNIIRMESDNNYTSVFVTNLKKPLLVAKTLKYFERLLMNTCFIRVHQSHLVNAKKIVRFITRKPAKLTLMNHEEISVSRARRSEIRNFLVKNNYAGTID